MKKMFLVMMILVIMVSFASAADISEYTAVKVGYGNETAGTGVAVEFKVDNFGVVVGAGSFGGLIGASGGVKGFIDVTETAAVFAGLNYGVLGYEWSSIDNVNILVYAPYILLGYVGVYPSGWYYDGSIGYGSAGETEYWEDFSTYAVQFSIGYAF